MLSKICSHSVRLALRHFSLSKKKKIIIKKEAAEGEGEEIPLGAKMCLWRVLTVLFTMLTEVPREVQKKQQPACHSGWQLK